MWDIPDSSRAPNARLILDGVEDLADGESQQSEMMFIGLWVWSGFGERMESAYLLKAYYP